MHWARQRERFRAILAGDGCIHPASVYDPISARIAEDLGFEAGMFAGSIAPMTVLGAPDLLVLTLSEFAAQAHRLCRAGPLPPTGDADHGCRNGLNAIGTVMDPQPAGAPALTLQDPYLPQTSARVGATRCS